MRKYSFVSAELFAKALLASPIGTTYNFTMDSSEEDFAHGEPEGWHGAMLVQPFDTPPSMLCSMWGGHGDELRFYTVADGEDTEHAITRGLKDYFAYAESDASEIACVEVDSPEHERIFTAVGARVGREVGTPEIYSNGSHKCVSR